MNITKEDLSIDKNPQALIDLYKMRVQYMESMSVLNDNLKLVELDFDTYKNILISMGNDDIIESHMIDTDLYTQKIQLFDTYQGYDLISTNALIITNIKAFDYRYYLYAKEEVIKNIFREIDEHYFILKSIPQLFIKKIQPNIEYPLDDIWHPTSLKEADFKSDIVFAKKRIYYLCEKRETLDLDSEIKKLEMNIIFSFWKHSKYTILLSNDELYINKSYLKSIS